MQVFLSVRNCRSLHSGIRIVVVQYASSAFNKSRRPLVFLKVFRPSGLSFRSFHVGTRNMNSLLFGPVLKLYSLRLSLMRILIQMIRIQSVLLILVHADKSHLSSVINNHCMTQTMSQTKTSTTQGVFNQFRLPPYVIDKFVIMTESLLT